MTVGPAVGASVGEGVGSGVGAGVGAGVVGSGLAPSPFQTVHKKVGNLVSERQNVSEPVALVNYRLHLSPEVSRTPSCLQASILSSINVCQNGVGCGGWPGVGDGDGSGVGSGVGTAGVGAGVGSAVGSTHRPAMRSAAVTDLAQDRKARLTRRVTASPNIIRPRTRMHTRHEILIAYLYNSDAKVSCGPGIGRMAVQQTGATRTHSDKRSSLTSARRPPSTCKPRWSRSGSSTPPPGTSRTPPRRPPATRRSGARSRPPCRSSSSPRAPRT